MDVLGRKRAQLQELLYLIRNERAKFEVAAATERSILDARAKDIDARAKDIDKRALRLRPFENLAQGFEELAAERAKFDKHQEAKLAELDKARLALDHGSEVFNTLVQEKTRGFPWLAHAYSEYQMLEDMRLAELLEQKPHPAKLAAQEVREQSRLRRAAQRDVRIYRYVLEYYETLFPWLVDFKGEELDSLLELSAESTSLTDDTGDPVDPAQKWLSPAEFASLPPAERNQRALDRWRHKPKSRWEVGRDYERYVGYIYENNGYAVQYQGIVRGFEDLGRDLICTTSKDTAVVQCKNWSKDKVIHEKHIFQLYGTVVAYRIESPNLPVTGVFCTTTRLSPRAHQFAEALDIEVKEEFPLGEYPCIKCNVSRRDSSRIYHLPFDQQYDRTVVEHERNECYVETVAEAERLGFRRAFRWRGPQDT